MEPCDCKDVNNRCDAHKDLVIGPNLLEGAFITESQTIPETDAMGREEFWRDLGR